MSVSSPSTLVPPCMLAGALGEANENISSSSESKVGDRTASVWTFVGASTGTNGEPTAAGAASSARKSENGDIASTSGLPIGEPTDNGDAVPERGEAARSENGESVREGGERVSVCTDSARSGGCGERTSGVEDREETEKSVELRSEVAGDAARGAGEEMAGLGWIDGLRAVERTEAATARSCAAPVGREALLETGGDDGARRMLGDYHI